MKDVQCQGHWIPRYIYFVLPSLVPILEADTIIEYEYEYGVCAGQNLRFNVLYAVSRGLLTWLQYSLFKGI